MSELAAILRREIGNRGVISFARFMELCLYCPTHGYYERHPKQIGCQGDFYTSVSTGSLFGELLASQFISWLDELAQSDSCESRVAPGASHTTRSEPTARYQLIEAGAHAGQLAHDILTWVERHRPDWAGRFEYNILEPSATRQEWQRETLSRFSPILRWLPSWNSCAARSVQGIIFSNELVDAFPVHKLAWDGATQTWFEWGVAVREGEFVWQRMLPTNQAAQALSMIVPPLTPELVAVLPDGYVIEVSPSAWQWGQRAADALRRGKLVTVDYGLYGDELLSPERQGGTLRAYRHHSVSADLLANPGEQDLTAHVNFSALEQAAASVGLQTESFSSQAQFLARVLDRLTSLGTPPEWLMQSLPQLKRLMHPEHLGRSFKVLVQSRP